MRIALCSRHQVFVEAFAHVLARRGESVIVLACDLDDLLADRLLDYVDAAVIDVGSVRDCPPEAFDALISRVPLLPIIALVEQDADIEDSAFSLLRPRAVCDKRQRMNDLLDVLDCVVTGGPVPRRRPAPRRSATSDQRGTRVRQMAQSISPREREVLCGLVRGADTVQLAHSLGISVATTRSHVQSILSKLGAHSRLAAVSAAIDLGLVDSRSAQWRSTAVDNRVAQPG